MQSVSPLAWLAAEGSRKLRDAGRDNGKVACFDPLLGWGERAEQRTECWRATSCQASRREALPARSQQWHTCCGDMTSLPLGLFTKELGPHQPGIPGGTSSQRTHLRRVSVGQLYLKICSGLNQLPPAVLCSTCRSVP